jgi:histidinol-phosphate phosphatase family protein
MRAIFLDRDGTVTAGIPKYERVDSVDKVELLDNTLEGLRLMTELDYLKFFVTNQAGLAEGIITEADFAVINNEVLRQIQPSGIQITKTYVCPHGEASNCECRKPKPKLLQDAAAEYDIDLANSWMIGDRLSDIQTGINAGTKTILVQTGAIHDAPEATFVAKDLLEAAQYIAGFERGPDNVWKQVHARYSKADWITKPSMFAETVRDYLPPSGKLLELGAGVGQDSAYFASLGYDVLATDLDVEKLEQSPEGKFAIREIDLRQPLPFDDESFDIVYAHLSLHYFDQETTERIFADIHRILKPSGVLAFFTNSTDDPEYNTGKRLEPDYFEIDGTAKRYLNVDAAKEFARDFKPLLADNNGETYKDSEKGIHHLIRFIGTK